MENIFKTDTLTFLKFFYCVPVVHEAILVVFLYDNGTFQETDQIRAHLQSMAIFFCLLFCSCMPTESSTIWMLKTHTDSAVFAHPCTHSNCGTPSTIRQSLMNGTDGICFALTPETECIEEFNARLRTLFLNNLTFMCKKIYIYMQRMYGKTRRLYFFLCKFAVCLLFQ